MVGLGRVSGVGNDDNDDIARHDSGEWGRNLLLARCKGNIKAVDMGMSDMTSYQQKNGICVDIIAGGESIII